MGSHLIGVVAGLAAWSLLAAGISLTATPPAFSPEGFRLAASATVSLGLLSTPTQAAIVVASVVVLVTFHAFVIRIFERLVGETHPPYRTGAR